MPKKLKGGTLWSFSTSILSENIKKLKRDPSVNFFSEKKSLRAENTLREYPLAPLRFLEDKNTSQAFEKVKVLRKQEFMKIVRKVDHTE